MMTVVRQFNARIRRTRLWPAWNAAVWGIVGFWWCAVVLAGIGAGTFGLAALSVWLWWLIAGHVEVAVGVVVATCVVHALNMAMGAWGRAKSGE